MNKKLLFATAALAALTACTNDEFENIGSSNVAENSSPVQFEVINNSEAMTRASMDGNTIKWSANDGDLFTLYHGVATTAGDLTTGYQNATYKASSEEGTAVLSTPSMILPGYAMMFWPVDTAFNIKSDGKLAISIPDEQKADIENYIPYVSDLVEIGAYNATTAAPNTAGYDRKYPIYMRPMASQLIVKADYAGTEEKIAELYEGENAIDPIKVTSVELLTDNSGSTKFTTKVPVKFTDPADALTKQWKAAVDNNAWKKVAGFDLSGVTSVDKLTTKCLSGNEGCKFLILPQAEMSTDGQGVAKAGVVVNTIYGKVIVAKNADIAESKYSNDEIADAWYRYVSAATTNEDGETNLGTAVASGDHAGKYKVTANIEMGLKQTINGFSKFEATKGVVKGEPVGTAATRYVKVLLSKLDMDGLHITSDKQLRDAARVWNHLGAGDVQVLLDGNADGEFEMSQKTIEVINEINAAAAKEATPRAFTVAPCNKSGEACNTIVITGGGDIQDLTFIVKGTAKADVAFNAGETWKWNGMVKVNGTTNKGIKNFINRGTMENAATATLSVYNSKGKVQQTDVPFVNNGTWNITAGTLNVQFKVTNNGIVNIAKGAQYRQDGTGNDFTNEAETLPKRFFMNDPSKTADEKKAFKESIGVVNNKGVFATVNSAKINNYGLIEHADKDAKTYITSQQNGAGFGTPWSSSNKIGRINLPYSNKDEDNISINAAASDGFVSVTVTSENAPANKQLDVSTVGTYVNYLIINSGVEQITNVNNQVKYVEVNDENNTEIAWMPRFTKEGAIIPYSYTGLIVLSPVNIKLKTTVTVTGSTYIAADMYVGGTFTPGTYNGYFGNTTKNKDTMYITY